MQDANGAAIAPDPAAARLGPLAGVRVLDLTHYLAGPRCTKLLADFGAEVLKIERPPAGDPARQLGPFPGDVPNPEASGTFLQLNTNKRSVTLNLRSVLGHRLCLELARRADIVVENFRPGVLESLGLGYETLAALKPELILTSISNFGQTGPYRDLTASELTLYAMGGPMNVTGHRSREPLKLAGNVVQYHAGSVAAYATLVALYDIEDAREAGEEPFGDHLDVAIYETQAGFRDRRVINLVAYAYTGDVGRRPVAGSNPGRGVRPTADGYVNITPNRPERYLGFLRMIGRNDLADRFEQERIPYTQIPPDLGEEIETSYLGWLMQHTKHEAAALAQANRVLAAPVNTVLDLVEDPGFNARGALDTIDHPVAGRLKYPGRPFVMSASPRPPARRAPLLGEHNVEVLCEELGVPRADLPRLREQGII